MAEQEQAKELYELCIEANKDDLMNPNFYDNCKSIETWIDNTIKSISIELGNKYNNDPQYKNMDLGEKGYLYFDEQIKLFFQTMQVEEHKEIYKHKNSYNAICSNLTSAISREYQVTKEIAQPNSLLKLNLFNIYEYWYEANTILTTYVLTDKIFANILKKHNVTLEQITNINWIIENRDDTEQIFSKIYKRRAKRIKELENLKSRANIKNYPTLPKKPKLESYLLPLDKTQAIYNTPIEEDTYLKYLTGGPNDIEKKLYTLVLLTLSNDIDKYSDTSLTDFDRDTLNAINNFIFHGYDTFTLNQVWGVYNNSHMNNRQQALLIKSINKLRTAIINIEASEEMKRAYKLEHDTYSGYILPVDVRYIELKNGKKAILISKLQPSTLNKYIYTPWLDYILDIQQFTTLTANAIKTPKQISYTDTTIAVKNYLLERIEKLYDEKNTDRKTWKDRTILFDSIFEKTKKTEQFIKRKDNLQRDQEKVINTAKRFLENWCNADNLFKRYEIKENERKIIIKYK